MNKILRYFLIFSTLSIIAFTVDAREWPDNPTFVMEPFGAAKGGHFSRGLSFLSEGQRVKAWGGGEVIWTSDSGDGLLVVEHEDGFRSSYNGIEKRPDLNRSVTRGEWLGYAGGDSWLFEITDIKQSRIVDPITLLPSRKNLNSAPVGVVELVNGSRHLELMGEVELPPGRWTVVVSDFLSSGHDAIPVEVSLFWVGESIGSLRFDALEESDNGVVLETPEPFLFRHVYNPDGQLWFPDVLLNAGTGTLELRIRDEIGRVVSRSWKLTVR
ncbi:MAG: hypothetical protein DRZ90_00465 [Spirochaetes bacterium]|nr:MAG: hypothetical protein DRP60_11985 [Spirochaetota bacterium]RKX99041.1 MAG: hypothetical protein DRZ90_00465 [Spirochaetota bacterium]